MTGDKKKSRMGCMLAAALVISVVILGLFGLGNVLYRKIAPFVPSGGLYSYSTSMDPVLLTFPVQPENVTFRIPQAFLVSKENRSGSIVDAETPWLRIAFVFPSMKPWAIATEEERGPGDRPSLQRNRVNVTIEKGAIPPQSRLAFATKLHKLEQQDQLFHGLVFHKNKADETTHRIDAFVPAQDVVGEEIFIECIGATPASTPDQAGCNVSTKLGARLGLSYWFRRARLPEWHEIDRAVRSKVESFILDEPNSGRD